MKSSLKQHAKAKPLVQPNNKSNKPTKHKSARHHARRSISTTSSNRLYSPQLQNINALYTRHGTQSQLISHPSSPNTNSSKRGFAINLSTVKSTSAPVPEQVPPPTPPTPEQPLAAAAAAPVSRPRPQLKAPLTITPSAAQRVLDICEGQDPSAKGIRLGVRTRGCSGLSYTMNFADGPASRLEEQVAVPNSDVKIFIDNKALLYVIGTTMDWTETDVATEFTFNNPNSKGSCGCGESFTV